MSHDSYTVPKRGIPCFGGKLDGRTFDAGAHRYPPGFDLSKVPVTVMDLAGYDCGGEYILQRVPTHPEWTHQAPNALWPIYVHKSIDMLKVDTLILQNAVWHWRT